MSTSHPSGVATEVNWTTLINNARINDSVSHCSASMDARNWSASWILIYVTSTLTPTLLRILIQFSDDGVTWWDFEEGLWASLCWEDVDTVSGVKKAYLLPLGGISNIRVCAIGTGTDANNFFDVTVKARQFTGSFGSAHA